MEPISEEESFENGLYYFAMELRDIAAGKRAKRLDEPRSINITGEFHYIDLGTAEAMLSHAYSVARIGPAAVAALRVFAEALRHVPIAHQVDVAESNIELVMAEDSWVPVARAAAELLKKLAPALERNAAYFRDH